MNNLVTKLSSVAALLGVIGAIGAGFVQYGKLVSKIEELDSREEMDGQSKNCEMEVKRRERKKMNEKNKKWPPIRAANFA